MTEKMIEKTIEKSPSPPLRRVRGLAAAGWLMALGGCSGPPGPLPDIPVPELMPEPQPYRAQTGFADGVLRIGVPTPDGGVRTLDTVHNTDWTGALYLPRPVQPGHSNREWILSDNHRDGRVILYALVSWDAADPTDYLSAGWWLTYPPDAPSWEIESAARGVFLDGPELDPANPPALPIEGTARYAGTMGGLYTYRYGRAWGELAGSAETTEFSGTMSLTADFGRNRITGCLGCAGPVGTAPGLHLAPLVPWQNPDPAASPAGYDIHFEAAFGGDGTFGDTAVTVTHPDRAITASAGTWRGQFSNVPDADGNPRRVVGSADALFAEDDGSRGQFRGIFDALTPAALEPPNP